MRHSGFVVGLVGAVLALGAALPSAAVAKDDCQVLDTGPIPNPAQAACDVGEEVVEKGPGGAAADAIAAPVKAAGDEVMKGVTTWVANGAGWLVGQAGKLIDETTTPRIRSDWFGRQYDAMIALAAVFALPLLLLAVMQGVLRRDGGLVLRAAAWHLPLAFLLTGLAVAVVSLLLDITDQASAQVAASVGNDAKEFFGDVGKSLTAVTTTTGQGAVPLFAVFLGGLVAAIAAFFVWIELLLRSAAVYVCVLFLPLTFVATIWPATAKWSRRLVELLVAIILSKFVIVAIMALAAAGLGNSRGDDAFQGVLAGAALMLLAAFSPFALLRLIPIAEAAAASASYRGGSGSQTLGPVASPGMVMRRVMDGNWGAGGAGAGGGGLRVAPAGASGGSAGGGAGGVVRAAGGAAGGVAAAGVGVAAGAKAAGGAVGLRAQGGGAAAGAAGGSSGAADDLRYAGTPGAQASTSTATSTPSGGESPLADPGSGATRSRSEPPPPDGATRPPTDRATTRPASADQGRGERRDG